MNVVIGILLRRSNIRITESQFERNNVGLGAAIYNELGSDVDIFNTNFVNNSAAQYCNNNCFNGGNMYVSKNRNTVNIYHSEFEKMLE